MAEKSAPPAKILLIDDQPANLDVLCRLLEAKGYNISVAASGAAGLKIAARVEPDLILLDVMMPEMDGLETCRQLKQDSQTAPVPIIFITASTMQEDVVAGFRAGGVDCIAKPFREEEVLVRVETQVRLRYQSRALEELAQQLADKNEELSEKNRVMESEIAQRKALKNQLTMISQREAQRWGLEDFIGQSPTIQRIFREIRLMQENATMGVLISGESGTGKELVARAIHFGSALADGPFVPVNCAAFPGELAESLLFGHVKGAFTGAANDQDGYFHMAHGGTVFGVQNPRPGKVWTEGASDWSQQHGVVRRRGIPSPVPSRFHPHRHEVDTSATLHRPIWHHALTCVGCNGLFGQSAA